MPGSNFEIDFNILDDGKNLTVKKRSTDVKLNIFAIISLSHAYFMQCNLPQSVMCNTCIPRIEFESSSGELCLFLLSSQNNVTTIIPVNPADILKDKQDGNEYYASFARIESMSSIGKLWETMQVFHNVTLWISNNSS